MENLEPVVVDDIEVLPAKRAPKCTRELFLRAPDWRYQEAAAYLRTVGAKETAPIPSDPFVQYAIRVMRAHRNKGAQVYLIQLWPDVESAIKLGTTLKRSAIVAEIEANIIHGRDAKYMYEHGFYVPAPVYALYEKLFFDLSGITAVHAWVNDFLLEPERHQTNSILLRSRLLAYYSTLESSANSAVTGMPMEAETTTLLKEMASTERQKKVFDYMVKATNMDLETYATVMEAAVKSMTERDFQEHMRDRDDVGSSSLEELAQNLESGIRAYSQQELAQIDMSGLDVNNKYVAAVLRKDTDDGKQDITNR